MPAGNEREIYPSVADTRNSGSGFRFGPSRHVELMLKEEFGVVAQRSVDKIIAIKEAEKQAPLSEEETISRKLKPEFRPEKHREPRRRNPIFHDPFKNTVIGNKKVQILPSIPIYNPLDKSTRPVSPGKSNKYPYRKDATTTIEEMKKPRQTSVGVVPSRSSKDISELKFYMEGTPAINNADMSIDVIQEVNKVQTPDSGRSGVESIGELALDFSTLHRLPSSPLKPAILSKTGTIQSVTFSERQKPPARPSFLNSKLKKRLKSGDDSRSMHSSLRSGDISLPEDDFNGKYDDVVKTMDDDLETAVGLEEDGRLSNASSNGTIKSVKELIEEAKKIAQPDSQPLYKQHLPKTPKKDTPRKKKVKKEKSKGSVVVKDSEEQVEGRTERTVDEIIASLRNPAQVSVSDADRRIKEIMDGVISRTSAVLGDFDEQQSQGQTTPVGGRTPEDSRPSSGSQPYFNVGSPQDLSAAPDNQEVNVPESLLEDEDNTEYEGLTDRTDEFSEYYTDDLKTPSLALIPSLPPPSELFTDREMELDEDREGIKPQLAEDESVDLQKAWEDLAVPGEATYEDIVSVQGYGKSLESRAEPVSNTSDRIPVHSSSVSFLSTWAPSAAPKSARESIPEEKSKPVKSIHHFCTVTSDIQLPKEFQQIGRKYHTPDKYKGVHPDQPYRFGKSGPVIPQTIPESPVSSVASDDRIAEAAQRILHEAQLGNTSDTLEDWQKRAESLFPSDMSAEGTKISIGFDDSRVYWNPAPPKLDVPPAQVRKVLYPEYKLHAVGAGFSDRLTSALSDSETESEAEDQVDGMDPEDQAVFDRIMSREYKSTEDLTIYNKSQTIFDENIKEGNINPYNGRKLLKIEDGETQSSEGLWPSFSVSSASVLYVEDTSFLPPYLTTDDVLPVFPLVRKSKSQPDLLSEDDTLLVPQDFTTAMEEIKEQKAQIAEIRLRKARGETEPLVKDQPLITEDEDEEDEFETSPDIELPVKTADTTEIKLTPAEQALEAGRSYVILPSKKKKKKKKVPVDTERIEAIEAFLSTEPKKLTRSESFPNITRVVERELRVPPHIRSEMRSSQHNLLDFDEFSKQGGIREDDDKREWVRDIWNIWFDELFPPTPSGSEGEEEEEKSSILERLTLLKPKTPKETKRPSTIQSVLSDVDILQPVEDTEENTEILRILREEIDKLSKLIDTNTFTAFDLCRRGALYRKIGELKNSGEDLNRAIELEPLLLDAYWHRHLLYILQDKKQQALDDLQFIMKKNKHHGGAYRSMAEIYRKQGDVTMAIVNFTQAIKHNPSDHEAYFQRAQMYEQRGELLLALEDYTTCKKIMPTRTDAIMKHGLYYFEHENDEEAHFSKSGKPYIPINFPLRRRNPNWNNAINDFTDLLRVDPLNATARLYRGRAYAKLGQWIPAVQDLSAAIHLDPHNWQAFYHRACIIRKCNPERALQDYSMSLLLDDSEDNIMSYLHRGILYNDLESPEDAIADFESVLYLNKDVACAHVCLGLIYMTKFHNYHRAIKKFTAAIKVDPTHLRAYICRGEAYHKIHELTLAIRDFTRAIHLRPDIQHYYMYRGQLILETGNLELAAFCVRQASELNSDTSSSSLGEKPTQQAVVQSFLKNYDKAIDALAAATRVVRDVGDSKPVAPLFMLLGKTQMKAKRFKDAVSSFNEALARLKPWRAREPWPIEASEAHYLSGVCHMEIKSYNDAVESFNSAIKIDSKYSSAFYQRGLARMKLKQSKGVQDFNKALAINPKIFQAYLSRACYFGMKKNYTKAILNCNEALKLQPNSVRAYLYRGALKYHIRVYDLAIRDLTKAATIDNTCSLAFFNRAVCYQENKQFDMALMDYGIVLLLGDQLLLKVFINRGLLYFERRDYDNALYDFQMSVKLSPHDHRIQHTLGLCYHKLGRLQDAVVTFTNCFKIKPFFLDGLIARGNVYMDYGHADGLDFARRDYERVLKLDPMCLPARVNLAYTLQVEGHLMQAWRQFTAAIEVNPAFKAALEGRAIVNLQMSNLFAASQDISQSIKVTPTAELLTNRGVIHQFMKDSVNSMRDYQAAIKLDPTYSLAYFNMGNINFHTRRFKQALYNYDKAVEFNATDESAYLNRAITKVLLRDAQGALNDFKSAIKLSPHSAHMYFNRANLYSSLQQYDKAEHDYNKALELVPDDALTLKRRADVRGKLGKREEAVTDYKHAIEIQGRPKRLVA